MYSPLSFHLLDISNRLQDKSSKRVGKIKSKKENYTLYILFVTNNKHKQSEANFHNQQKHKKIFITQETKAIYDEDMEDYLATRPQ